MFSAKGGEKMTLELVATKIAPAAVGPYSQGVKAGNIIFLQANCI